tara:strand:- start:97 stop:675 length:579 start_codon:yes stop_codon:yes gene_type:complete
MGYGNNAAPVAEGKCCDNCNFTQVICARLVKEVVEEDEEEEECCQSCGTTCLDHTSNKGRGSEEACPDCKEIRCKHCPCECVEEKEEPLCECCFEAPSQGLSCDQCANPCCAECIDSHPLGCGSICSECIEQGEECQVGCANRWHIDDPRQCEICHEYGCEDCVEWNEENNDYICCDCLEDANEEEEEEQQG